MQLVAQRLDSAKLPANLIVFARSGGKLATQAAAVDKKLNGALAAALKNSRFQGDAEEILTVTTPDGVVCVVGLGKAAEVQEHTLRMAAIVAGKQVDSLGLKEIAVVMEKETKVSEQDAVLAVADGVRLAVYRFDRFKTEQKPHQKAMFKKLAVLTPDAPAKGLKEALEQHAGLFEGVELARDLVNLPANYANPDHMEKEAKALAKMGIKVEVLGEKEMEKLGMGLLLAVGRGSKQQSRLIIMRYMGGDKKDPVHAVVGKGVMFDTGGYDLKPADGMQHMKGDMAGSAAVMGLMKALAGRKSKVNVIGVCGCVMNMIDGDAFLPSDILTSYKGLTVEIGNTDAEGRLVLADALAYIIDKEKPAEVVDLATLTGACMVALGAVHAGVFSNNDKLAAGLQQAGEVTGESLWRLPIGPAYTKMLKSSVADLNNIGGRWGGASSAAAFLHRFVGDTPWAHLDIAGVAMAEKIQGSLPVSGASGFGVRLLTRYLESK